MNEKPEAKKKKPVSAETPVHTIRQSPSGYAYYDSSLARSWQSLSSGSTGNSRNFFAKNQAELMKVIEQASQWIAEHEVAGRQPLAA